MIRIDSLTIVKKDEKSVPLVDIAFEIGESLALVGESGSGKSLTLKALLGLLPASLEGRMTLQAPFDLIRGKTVAFVPQNPFTALSPMTRIRRQWFSSEKKARELFDLMGLEWSLFDRYPPQLSGGQLQRVVFAIALGNNPRLLLLDEPTTALDPRLREEIGRVLVELRERFNFAMLFVTHDINLAGKICRDMLVIRQGRVVESGPSNMVLRHPEDEYTRRLVEASFARREFRQ